MEDGHANILDLMNPPGTFVDGKRQQEYSNKYLLPTSGRLIPEFDKRRNIKDMFTRKPSQKPSTASTTTSAPEEQTMSEGNNTTSNQVFENSQGLTRKRSEKNETAPATLKRSKSTITPAPAPSAAGQKTLKGFFKPKTAPSDPPSEAQSPSRSSAPSSSQPESMSFNDTTPTKLQSPSASGSAKDDDFVIDPIVSKEDWSKLFNKNPPPNCEGHQEPCVSLTTKKPGVNCGRAFWICQRPVGPTGNKEKGTQWRCPTFIWASDWNSS